MRVASKPAFAVVIGAALFLAQDLFTRITGIPLSNDESVAIVTLGSWLAYWIVPASLQDGAQITLIPAPPTVPPAA